MKALDKMSRADRLRYAQDTEDDMRGIRPRHGMLGAEPDAQNDGDKMDADAAGYMELDGAQKDADCDKVEVEGGVSTKLGCCNLYQPTPGAQAFRCGLCQFVDRGNQPGPASAAPKLQSQPQAQPQAGIASGDVDA